MKSQAVDRWRARVNAWTDWAWSRMSRRQQLAGRLVTRTVRDSFHDRVPGLAAEAALFTLLSLPSLLLVMLGSLGYLANALGPRGRQELDRLVYDAPQTFLTESTYSSYQSIADVILREGRADVVSVGVIVSLWTGSRAMNRYLETITIAYDMEDPRPLWTRRLLAFGLTVAGLVGAVAILPALVIGPRFLRWLAPSSYEQVTDDMVDIAFWPGLVLIVVLALALLYHVGVPWRTPWRRDLPGAALAVVLWLLTAAGLRAYIAYSLQDDAVYGRLAAPVAVVLWIYVTAIAVLLGAELNAEIERMWPHEKYPWRLRRLRRLWRGRRHQT